MATIKGSAASNGNYLYIVWSESDVSTANNTSKVTATVYLSNGYGSHSDGDPTWCTLTIDGTSYSGTYYTWSGNPVTLKSASKTITHGTDGKKSITISASFDTNGTSTGIVSASGTATLTAIARGTTCTHTVQSTTETTATIKWTAGDTCDKVWTKVGSGSWQVVYNNSTGASSGTYTVSGLTPNTKYAIITDVRRKSSQVETQSATAYATTYAYPYCTSAPEFTIGNPVTIGLYNPLSRACTVSLKASNDTEAQSSSTSTTSVSLINTTDAENILYNSLPNSTSGTYTVSVTYETSTTTKTGTYRVGDVAKPIITNGTYQDTNTTITAITGDDQQIIPNRSTVTFNGTGIATNKGASAISSVILNIGGQNYEMTLSSGTATVSNITITSVSLNQASIVVTDSRGLTNTKTVSLSVVNYNAPTVSATAKRESGFYSSTIVKPIVNYTTTGSNTVAINLEATTSGETTQTYTNLQNNQEVTYDFNNQKIWTLTFTATDSFGSIGTYVLELSQGIPLAFFDTKRLSVGVNMFPEHDKSVEVNGRVSHLDMTEEEMEAFMDEINSNFTGRVDYIVEEGTVSQSGAAVSGYEVPTTTWYYRKWESGKAECWGQNSFSNFTPSSTWGAGGYKGIIAYYPSELFIARPIAQVTCEKTGGSGIPMTTIDLNHSSSNIRYFIFEPNGTTRSYPLNTYVYAFGNWR